MNELTADIAYSSLIKLGEQLCGDHVEMIENDDGSVVLVLADGMGSGVKANILSTLTSKIISTMINQKLSVNECVKAIIDTLPVCRERCVAYCTFTIIRLSPSLDAEITQYDNPHVFLLRDGKFSDMPETCDVIENRKVYSAHTKLKEADVLIAMSDGALHANSEIRLNLDWERPQIISYMEKVYKPDYTAKMLSSVLLEKINSLYGGEPGDDTTVCAVKVRKRRAVNLMFGPPAHKEDDNAVLEEFFGLSGKHVLCGGTTAEIASRYLGADIIMGTPSKDDPSVPPICKLKGADLVTEGVITVSRLVENVNNYNEEHLDYLDWVNKGDGVSLLSQLLLDEASDINFFVGRAINPAHQNPNLPISFNLKMKLIEELADRLKKMGKRVKVKYF